MRVIQHLPVNTIKNFFLKKQEAHQSFTNLDRTTLDTWMTIFPLPDGDPHRSEQTEADFPQFSHDKSRYGKNYLTRYGPNAVLPIPAAVPTYAYHPKI